MTSIFLASNPNPKRLENSTTKASGEEAGGPDNRHKHTIQVRLQFVTLLVDVRPMSRHVAGHMTLLEYERGPPLAACPQSFIGPTTVGSKTMLAWGHAIGFAGERFV